MAALGIPEGASPLC